MKLTTSALLSGLCWSARLASAASANFYTYDPQSPPRPQPRSLAPVAARLVLAQRAGVEDFHSADLEQEDVIAAINDFGVRTPLFADEQPSLKRAFILLEEDESIPSLNEFSSFSLSQIPSSQASRGLFVDLAKQSDPKALASSSEDEVMKLIDHKRYLFGTGHIFSIVESAAELEDMFLSLVNTHKYSITAMTMPRKTSGEELTWGTYELPNQKSVLKKRQQRGPEMILTDAREFQPVQSAAPLAASNSTYNYTTPLRGILPACYTTQEHCEKATRNCSGHGSCSKKYRDPDSGNSGLDCFSCSCKATVVQNANGKKTTTWGGPACQKKDVSIEFWLIALFTVGLVFLVSFAVGSVWEMGSEELPSVIGAGVSGPTARK